MPNRPPIDRSQTPIQGSEPTREIPKTHGGIPRTNGVSVTQEWRTRPSREGQIALALVALCVIVAALARRYTVGRPLDAETLVATVVGLAALLLAMVIGVLAYGHRSLRYRLDKRALTIGWLWMEEIIPLAGIEAIFRGTRLGQKVRVRGVYEAGTAEADEVGQVKFYGSGRDSSTAIIVATAERGYAITPSDLEGFRGRLIELLEVLPGGEAAQSAEARTVRSYLPTISPLELRKAIIWTAGVALGAALLWGILQIPVNVPDASSPPAGTAVGTVNDWTSVGQSFVVRWNNLDSISVVLAAEKPTNQAAITFNVKEEPHGPPLRSVRRTISQLPVGNPLKMRPGTLQERWETFNFAPIPNSAGRKLYFSVEGKGVQHENTVNVLMFFHSGYPQGTAFMNEKSVNAHLPFRASSRGKVADYVTVLSENLTRNRPGPLGNPLTYLALGLLYLGLVALLLKTARRIGRQSSVLKSP